MPPSLGRGRVVLPPPPRVNDLKVRLPTWQSFVVFVRKTLNAYFPLGPSSLPVVMAQPDERLANRMKRGYSAFVWLDRRGVHARMNETPSASV